MVKASANLRQSGKSLFSRIVRQGIPPIASVGKTLVMLEAVLRDAEGRNIARLARVRGIALATAHRQVKTLVEERYLSKLDDGRHVAGPRLRELLYSIEEKQVVADIAAGPLRDLAAKVDRIVQFGTLENEMVTYRVKAGRGAEKLFTEVDKQLEAYCSGIGKVLLAWLPDAERQAYLANGPFPRLTPNTICEPDALARELSEIRSRGYAVDDGEISERLHCIAVPIRKPDGSILAAISASDPSGRRGDDKMLHDLLARCARDIERLAF